jgi:hypothetical protein
MRNVELRATDATSSFSLYEGVVRDPAFDQFLYEGASAGGVVEVREDGKGVKTLRLYSGWMGPRPPKKVFEETRSFMDVVYEGLRRRLPELPPSSEVHEEIIRPPLR